MGWKSRRVVALGTRGGPPWTGVHERWERIFSTGCSVRDPIHRLPCTDGLTGVETPGLPPPAGLAIVAARAKGARRGSDGAAGASAAPAEARGLRRRGSPREVHPASGCDATSRCLPVVVAEASERWSMTCNVPDSTDEHSLPGREGGRKEIRGRALSVTMSVALIGRNVSPRPGYAGSGFSWKPASCRAEAQADAKAGWCGRAAGAVSRPVIASI